MRGRICDWQQKQDMGDYPELMSKLITPARSSAEIQIRLNRMRTEDTEKVKIIQRVRTPAVDSIVSGLELNTRHARRT